MSSGFCSTRIDYCNSLRYGTPAATFDPFQHVQNILARVVTQSARRSSAKRLLESLYWLPDPCVSDLLVNWQLYATRQD